MSAIAHGWQPSHGDVAKIPVTVAKEFHAADAGHKYGAKHKMSKSYHADGGGITSGYRANDPDHPMIDPHRGLQRQPSSGYSAAYASGNGHLYGTCGGHRLGSSAPARNASTFRNVRGRKG